jgi:hypothetical protein
MILTDTQIKIIIESDRKKPEGWTDQDEMIYHAYQILIMAIGKRENLSPSYPWDFTFELFKFFSAAVIKETMAKLDMEQDAEWFDQGGAGNLQSKEFPKEQYVRTEPFGSPAYELQTHQGWGNQKQTEFWRDKTKKEYEEDKQRQRIEKELRKEIAIKLEEEQEHEEHMEELRQAEIAEKTIDLTKHSRFTKYK